MVTLVPTQSQRTRVSVPSVSLAGVAWPYDKIALVVAAVAAIIATLLVTGSGEVASWVGLLVGIGAFVATRMHYGAAVTARES
ncbi:hypothetical protein GOEFS_081_00030 [Gordonia effusa NBRC 100432]|uniref:Uncharacterized protein n=1 Tax=Gordonia effusa NBRC 100432 TaxID=1077974 RepID=H0R2L3_9ACTN|nr:hypothetical protein [Gordonia effusa]GAB19314.1 hypothetical protein GOEFS_081_00030 [Gordonia effusa NBRC 100432]